MSIVSTTVTQDIQQVHRTPGILEATFNAYCGQPNQSSAGSHPVHIRMHWYLTVFTC